MNQVPPDNDQPKTCTDCGRTDDKCECDDVDVLELRPPQADADDNAWGL